MVASPVQNPATPLGPEIRRAEAMGMAPEVVAEVISEGDGDELREVLERATAGELPVRPPKELSTTRKTPGYFEVVWVPREGGPDRYDYYKEEKDANDFVDWMAGRGLHARLVGRVPGSGARLSPEEWKVRFREAMAR